MIPCTLRPRLLLNNALRAALPKHSLATKKLYTTDNHDSSTSKQVLGEDSLKRMLEEEIEKEEAKHFWEIDSQKPHFDMHKSLNKSQETMHKDTIVFGQLLSGLFPTKKKNDAPITPLPNLSKKASSIIEEKLLEMVIQNKKPYKPQAPLPRSAVGAMYANTTERLREPDQQDDDILDFLTPSNTTNWNSQDVLRNENIQLKDKEMNIIKGIVEAENRLELLQRVQTEINQEKYPTYYPHVLAKAIQHASRKDPYLALAIFEQAKNKSMTSYIAGCTTTVYNSLLMLRWDIWRDIYGMLDLVEEMAVNGIAYDNDTRRVIRSVVNEMEAEGSYTDEDATGVYWNAEERRSCHIMKELAGKWLITKV